MRIRIVQSDITKEAVDAIVNAANAQLAGGGGVDGAIHRAAGPDLMAECDKIRAQQGGCATGSAVITGAGRLQAKHVIHAVGPVWRGGRENEDALLTSAYASCLAIAEANALATIAFPNISTGVYGFPKPRAADIVATVIRDFKPQVKSLKEIRFVCFDQENLDLYKARFGG